MKTDIVEGELSIDIPGLSIFTQAKYHIDSFWDGGELTSAAAVITDWKCDGEWQSRSWLSSIASEKRVIQAEDSFAERWAETAEADARDAHADLYRRDEDEARSFRDDAA